MKKLIILSTCSQNKKHSAHPSCHLDNNIKNEFTQSIKSWLGNISNSLYSKYLPINLYSGSHWKETKACFKIAQENGLNPELWILSAGWGLIRSDYPICSYSATFSNGQDSIHNLIWPLELSSRDHSRIWWKEINKRRNINCENSLRALMRSNESTDALFLFIISREYFFALESELIELASCGGEYSIISAGVYSEIGGVNPIIKPYVFPLGEKLKQLNPYLNKTNVSLNSRLATWIIKNYSSELFDNRPFLFERLQNIEASLPEIIKPDIVSMTDDEVLDFIDRNFCPYKSSATQLLRILRSEEKKSCEQKRFGKLFRWYLKNKFKGDLFNG